VTAGLREQVERRMKRQRAQGINKAVEVPQRRTYRRGPQSFRSRAEYESYRDRVRRVAEDGPMRGQFGEDLKRNLLKVLRGEGYVPPGYSGLRGETGGLADFIEEHVDAEIVEVMFEDDLNFTFLYSHLLAVTKLTTLAFDILRDRELGPVFRETGYADAFFEWVDQEVSMVEMELEDLRYEDEIVEARAKVDDYKSNKGRRRKRKG
jgi:hypothetical protein